ncbi:putative ligand gated channel (GIC family) [Prochlorococcus sp. MIT 0703]|nr:putative ligand gated channel (GIC family) [Prochlorococcus sp. MIT 0703]
MALRVGVSGSPPFVDKRAGVYEGISVEVWRQIANAKELEYILIQYPNVDSNIKAVADGKIDLAIGPISITPDRVANNRIEFTQPYFYAEEGVLVPSQPPGLWKRIKPLFGVAALSSITFLLFTLFCVGNLIWLAERKRNPEHFPPQYIQGVGNGIWFALVTLTTVGYGDRAPLTKAGRSIAGVWMVISLVSVSTITAGLASAFTVSLSQTRLSGVMKPSDLDGELIGVVAGTTGASLARSYGARPFPVPTLKDAINLIKKNNVSGVISDKPILSYYMKNNPDKSLKLAPFRLSLQTYGFVLPSDSPFERLINIELLRLERSRQVRAITDRLLK